jgi:hypothetical protein
MKEIKIKMPVTLLKGTTAIQIAAQASLYARQNSGFNQWIDDVEECINVVVPTEQSKIRKALVHLFGQRISNTGCKIFQSGKALTNNTDNYLILTNERVQDGSLSDEKVVLLYNALIENGGIIVSNAEELTAPLLKSFWEKRSSTFPTVPNLLRLMEELNTSLKSREGVTIIPANKVLHIDQIWEQTRVKVYVVSNVLTTQQEVEELESTHELLTLDQVVAVGPNGERQSAAELLKEVLNDKLREIMNTSGKKLEECRQQIAQLSGKKKDRKAKIPKIKKALKEIKKNLKWAEETYKVNNLNEPIIEESIAVTLAHADILLLRL